MIILALSTKSNKIFFISFLSSRFYLYLISCHFNEIFLMSKRLLTRLNILLALIAGGLLLLGGYFYLIRPSVIPPIPVVKEKLTPPKGAFVQPSETYQKIGDPALKLQSAPISPKLPDLRKVLLFYGKNGRPDAKPELTQMHFSFLGNKTPSSVLPGEKLYLYYDRILTPPQYVFSKNNEKTCLWIEPSFQEGGGAFVKVAMCGEKGDVVTEPSDYAQFALPEKEMLRVGGATTWEIGKYRVDGTLLARLKARWYGVDKFLERHGGKEYQDAVGKQRIDFGEKEDLYSVYINVGDVLVWDNNRWKVVLPGEASLGKPIMIVKKIDDRLLNFELWDVEGKGKIQLNLLKSVETWTPQNLQQNFKFVGARTRSQFVFEIDKERIFLSPQDWLIQTEEGWKKLMTAEEIDDYVDRKKIGPMFVFDGVVKIDNRQVLSGVIFSPSRADSSEIEIPMQQGVTPTNTSREKVKKINNSKRRLQSYQERDEEDEDTTEDDDEE